MGILGVGDKFDTCYFPLVGNTSEKIKTLFSKHPLLGVMIVTLILTILFGAVHYVGTEAGRDRGRTDLRRPDQLRTVSYEYIAESKAKPKRSYGYLLMLTKDALYVLYEKDLLAKVSPDSRQPATQDLTIVPLDRLSFVRVHGYSGD